MRVGIVMCTISHTDKKNTTPPHGCMPVVCVCQCVRTCVSRVSTVVDQLPSCKALGAMCGSFCGECVCLWQEMGRVGWIFQGVLLHNQR